MTDGDDLRYTLRVKSHEALLIKSRFIVDLEPLTQRYLELGISFTIRDEWLEIDYVNKTSDFILRGEP